VDNGIRAPYFGDRAVLLVAKPRDSSQRAYFTHFHSNSALSKKAHRKKL
jgi:hypothetical protein